MVMKFLKTQNRKEKVSGVILDNKINFATRLLNVTKNANKEFNALTQVQKYMTTDQKKFIFPPLLNRNLSTVVDMDVLYRQNTLSSDKILITSEISTHLNLIILEQRNLANSIAYGASQLLKDVSKEIRNSS